MGLIFIAIYVFPIIAAIAAFFVAKAARKKLEAAGNRYPKLLSVVAFLVSFVLILVTISYLVLSNVQLRR